MDSPYLFLHAPRLSLGVFVKPPVPNPSYTGFLALTTHTGFPLIQTCPYGPASSSMMAALPAELPFPGPRVDHPITLLEFR